MLVLLLLVTLAGTLADFCTYTTHEWTQLACSQNVTDTMCGTNWCPLLRVDAASMLLAENQPWLLAFHIYATAALNRRSGTSLGVNFTDSGIDQAFFLLGDSLEAACENVTQWHLTPSLVRTMDLLFAFNHGVIPRGGDKAPLTIACGDEFREGNITRLDTTFYYINAPDMITLRDSTTGLTISTSVLKQLYSTQLFLFLFNIVEGVIICLLVLKLIIMRSEEREYTWLKKNVTEEQRLEAIELSILDNSQDIDSMTDEEIK